MERFRKWFAEQEKATIFNSTECEKAAALYAAGRGSEAEQAIAHLPPQIKHAMMQLFEKGFPKPQNMDATARALADPEFGKWVRNKLMPMITGKEEKKSE